METTLETWELKGDVKSYHLKRYDVSFIDGKRTTIEDEFGGEKVIFNKDGFIIARRNFEYDSKYQFKFNKRKINIKKFKDDDYVQLLIFDSDEEFYNGEHTFKFNKKGHLIHENYYGNDGNLNSYIFYHYDDWGRMIKSIHFRDFEEYMTVDYKFDFEDKIIERNTVYSDTPEYSRKITYEFNEDGLIKCEKHLDAFFLPTYNHQFFYLMDDQGNWTRKTAYQENKEIWFEERDIRYFDEPF